MWLWSGENKKEFIQKEDKPNKGIGFPRIAMFFATVGILSEVVDGIFLYSTLAGNSGRAMEDWMAAAVAAVIALACYASMAIIGYQRGKHGVDKVRGEWIGYTTWVVAGFAIVGTRIWVGGGSALFFGREMSSVAFTEFSTSLAVSLLQLFLYFGTGFMSRDSAQILADNNIWEYRRAKKHYETLLDELEDKRKTLKEGISILQIYPTYAERLSKSKSAVLRNIAQYNESARAMIEAKMAVDVSPDLMEGMYDAAMQKSGVNPIRNVVQKVSKKKKSE